MARKPILITETDAKRRVSKNWRLALFFYLLFIASFTGNFYQIYKPQELFHWIVCLAQLFPALVFLPALLIKHRNGVTWFCFVLMLYFCFTVINLSRPVAWPWLAYVELISEVGFFCAAIYFARFKGVVDKEAYIDSAVKPTIDSTTNPSPL